MIKKNLIYRYLLPFCLVTFTTLILFSQYKKDKIEKELEVTLVKTKKEFNKAFYQSSNLIELIFSNSILYDNKIKEIFHNIHLNRQKAKVDLYEYLKNSYYYFETFDIKNIDFYLPNNELFLCMADFDAKGKNGSKESVSFTNTSKKEFAGFEVDDKGMSLTFIKPFFDKNLEHLGSIQVKISVDNIIKNLEQDGELKSFFVYESYKKGDIEFPLNKNFKVDKRLYYRWNYKVNSFANLDFKNRFSFRKNMEIKKDFSFTFKKNGEEFIALFHYIDSPLDEKKKIYLVSYLNKKSIDFSLENVLVGIIILLYILITLITYILYSWKSKEKRSRKKYKDLVNAIDKYVIMVETDKIGIITSVTKAFCDASGYAQKELIGKNINLLRHPDTSNAVFKKMWEDLNSGNIWQGEIKNLDKNGNSYWVKGTIFPKFDVHKNIIGFVSIRVDVSNTKQLKKINNLLKEDLSTKLTEIRALDKNMLDNTKVDLMGKILSSMSHQWKNPISNITILLASLRARVENSDLRRDELKALYNDFETELKYLSNSLNDFKSLFEEAQSGSKYAVNEVLNDSIATVKNECNKKKIKILFDHKKEIYCFGIFNELKHAVTNLLRNSINKLEKSDLENPSILISIIEDENEVLIKYKDNLPNSSCELFNEVFSKNYSDGIYNNKDVNLYIVKLLMDKIGGNIWCDSNEEGRTFYMKLVLNDRRKKKR